MSHCTGKLHTLSGTTCIHLPLDPSQEHPQYRLGNEQTDNLTYIPYFYV